MIRTAVILAAGRGTRLGPEFRERPKCSLVVGGQTLINRSLSNLHAVGMERVVIGTGHCAEYLYEIRCRDLAVECVKNEEYATTGSMSTLAAVSEVIDDDFLLLESDLIYERFALIALMERPESDVVLGSGWTQSSDEVYIETDRGGRLYNMSKDPAELRSLDAELVGITKLTPSTLESMCRVATIDYADNPTLDYEYALVAAGRERPIQVHREEHLAWGEIDDEHHLRRVESSVLPIIFEHDRRLDASSLHEP